MVEGVISGEIAGFQGGVPQPEFEKFLKDFIAGRITDIEDYNDMRNNASPQQRATLDIVRKGKNMGSRDKAEIRE